MSRPDPGNEPSMDDILDSIRRIITDDPPSDSIDAAIPQQVAAQQAPTIVVDSLLQPNAGPAMQSSAPMGDGLMPQTAQLDDDDILDLVEETMPDASPQANYAFGAEQAQTADHWQMPPPPEPEHEQAEVPVSDDFDGVRQPDFGIPALTNGAVADMEDAFPQLDMPNGTAEPLVADAMAEIAEPVADYAIPNAPLDGPAEPAGEELSPPEANLTVFAPHALPGPLAAPEPTPLPFEFRSVGADSADSDEPAPFRADRLSDFLAATPAPSETLFGILPAEPIENVSEDSADSAPLLSPFETPSEEPPAADVAPMMATETDLAVPSDDLGFSGDSPLPAEPEILASMGPIEPLEAEPNATSLEQQELSSDLGFASDPATSTDLTINPVAVLDDGELAADAQPDYAVDQTETSSDRAVHVEPPLNASAIAGAALSAGDVAAGSGALGDAEGARAQARSLEDVVIETMRPMLQEWIDKNMPEMADKLLREFAAQSPTDDDTGS